MQMQYKRSLFQDTDTSKESSSNEWLLPHQYRNNGDKSGIGPIAT